MSIRRIEVTVARERADEVLEVLTGDCELPRWDGTGVGVVALQGELTVVYQVTCTAHDAGAILTALAGVGCGEDFGLISVFTIDAAKPTLVVEKHHATRKGGYFHEFASQSMCVEEIYNAVVAGAEVSFNSVCNLVAAALIAGVGLAVDSPVSVVASMLISPMMGPIVGFTLGAHIGDRGLAARAARSELAMITMTWVAGAALGMGFAPFAEHNEWPTAEMAGRGNVVNFYASIVVAAASGVVVGVGVTSGGVNALVGTAISASLLPPIVNSGMLCSVYVCLRLRIGLGLRELGVDAAWRQQIRDLSLVSFGLFLMNVLVIFVTCNGMFYIKGILPIAHQGEDHWKRKREMFERIASQKRQALAGAANESGKRAFMMRATGIASPPARPSESGPQTKSDPDILRRAQLTAPPAAAERKPRRSSFMV